VELVELGIERVEEREHRIELHALEAERDRVIELVAPVGIEGVDRAERDRRGAHLGDEVGNEGVRCAYTGLRCREAEDDGDVDTRLLHHLVVGVGRDDRVRLAALGPLPVVFVLITPVLRLVTVAVDVDDHARAIRLRSGASAVSNRGRATSSAAAAVSTGRTRSRAGSPSSPLGAETDSASAGAPSVGNRTAMQVTPRLRSSSSTL